MGGMGGMGWAVGWVDVFGVLTVTDGLNRTLKLDEVLVFGCVAGKVREQRSSG